VGGNFVWFVGMMNRIVLVGTVICCWYDEWDCVGGNCDLCVGMMNGIVLVGLYLVCWYDE